MVLMQWCAPAHRRSRVSSARLYSTLPSRSERMGSAVSLTHRATRGPPPREPERRAAEMGALMRLRGRWTSVRDGLERHAIKGEGASEGCSGVQSYIDQVPSHKLNLPIISCRSNPLSYWSTATALNLSIYQSISQSSTGVNPRRKEITLGPQGSETIYLRLYSNYHRKVTPPPGSSCRGTGSSC